MRVALKDTLPQICAYFNMSDFNNVMLELDKFDSQVEQHYQEFEKSKEVWNKIKLSL